MLERIAMAVVGLLLALAVALAVEADVRLVGALAGLGPPAEAADPATRHIATREAEPGRTRLAASIAHGGSWRLVNAAGEQITAAGADELSRALTALAPAAAGRPDRVQLVLTAATMLRHPEAVGGLPRTLDLYVLIGDRAHPIVRGGRGLEERLRVAVGPGLLVEADAEATLEEIVHQLERPVRRDGRRDGVRTVGLVPGGPTSIARTPQADASQNARPDAIDPAHLGPALPRLSGQLVLLSGRLAQDRLLYKPSKGADGAMSLAEVMAAAGAADVDLIVLATSSTRQPGTRNWLWRRMALANLDSAAGDGRLGDLLYGLAGGREPLVVRAKGHERNRIALSLGTARRDQRPLAFGGLVSGTWAGIVSETAGSLGVVGMHATLVTRERQHELDRRLVPGVPSWVQLGYFAVLFAGLVAMPTVRGWWRVVWPTRPPGLLTSGRGPMVTRGLRAATFVAVFLPLAGLPALLARSMRPASGPSDASSRPHHHDHAPAA